MFEPNGGQGGKTMQMIRDVFINVRDLARAHAPPGPLEAGSAASVHRRRPGMSCTIMGSTALKSNQVPGYAYNAWNYAVFEGRLSPEGGVIEICVDSGSPLSLVDAAFLRRHVPHVQRRRCNVNIQGVGNGTESSSEYALLDFYVPGLGNGQPAMAHFRREVHIVKNLEVKILVGMDIIGPEGVVINAYTSTLIINSCSLSTKLRIIPRSQAKQIFRTLIPSER